MASFQEEGDHSRSSPGGKEVEPLDTRGAEVTSRLVVVVDRGALSDEGVKAATPLRLDARRMAALLVDNLIVDIYYSNDSVSVLCDRLSIGWIEKWNVERFCGVCGCGCIRHDLCKIELS